MSIPKLVLDPRNDEELLEQCKARILELTEGVVNDFRIGSPLLVLLETMILVCAETLWFLNMLPEALAIEVFRLSGISRDLGTPARGKLTFLLSASRLTPFVVYQGYSVIHQAADQTSTTYVTTQELIIPAGDTVGTVDAVCSTVGSVYNIQPLAIFQSQTGLSGVQQVYNPEAFQGGTDLEPIEATIERASRVLRTRNILVSISDYEARAVELLGGRALCVPLLSSDKVQEKPGQVHLFLCDDLGEPVAPSVCANLRSVMLPETFAASQLWVSGYEREPLNIEVTVRSDVADIADRIYASLSSYLSPLSYPWGSTVLVQEINYQVRSTEGVDLVYGCLINGEQSSLPLGERWHCPQLGELTVNILDSLGTIKDVQYRGDVLIFSNEE